MRIKNKLKNKLNGNHNFLINDKIEKKNNFNKRTWKIKRMSKKLKKLIYHKFELNNEIQNHQNFYKKIKKKKK